MKIKGKLTNILFACALLASVGGESARAAVPTDTGVPCDVTKGQPIADSHCPTTCKGGTWKPGSTDWFCDRSKTLTCVCEEI